MITKIEIAKGDCLEKMKLIPDNSVDFILTDPPYGTTACKWDSVIPFEPMWEQIWRVLKPNGACALFGSEPFSSHLRMSQIKFFKYDWYWKKTKASGHLNAKKQPMRDTELVSIFYRQQCIYLPQGLEYGEFNNNRPSRTDKKDGEYVFGKETHFGTSSAKGYPKQTVEFSNPNNKLAHPTQKPVALLEYLIKTYTLEGETVLDFTMGSGSTGVAAVNLDRSFIGIEQDDKYFDIAKERILKAKENQSE